MILMIMLPKHKIASRIGTYFVPKYSVLNSVLCVLFENTSTKYGNLENLGISFCALLDMIIII